MFSIQCVSHFATVHFWLAILTVPSSRARARPITLGAGARLPVPHPASPSTPHFQRSGKVLRTCAWLGCRGRAGLTASLPWRGTSVAPVGA